MNTSEGKLNREFRRHILLRDLRGGMIRCPVCKTDKSPRFFDVARILPLYSVKYDPRYAVSICRKCNLLEENIKQKLFEIYGTMPDCSKFERLIYDHIYTRVQIVELENKFQLLNQKIMIMKNIKCAGWKI